MKRIFALLLCCAAFFSSWLPLMRAYSPGELVSGDIIIRGFNLMEFSAWGVLPVLIPALLAALTCCQLDKQTKFKLWFGLTMLYAVGFVSSWTSAAEWLRLNVNPTIELQITATAFSVLPFFSSVAAFFAIHESEQEENNI